MFVGLEDEDRWEKKLFADKIVDKKVPWDLLFYMKVFLTENSKLIKSLAKVCIWDRMC